MNRKSTFPRRVLGRLASAVALALATTLCAAPLAHAGVLNFETPVDNPFVYPGDVLTFGKYYVEGAADEYGFAGAVANNDSCSGSGLQCPTNNATNYYTGLDDGYMYFGMTDGSGFSLTSLDASFIGTGLASYPATAALLYLEGFDANGVVATTYLRLAGPVGGSFNFSTYDLSDFGGGKLFTNVLVASFACDANGNCDRTHNQAQFAIDNIVTVDTNDVPEPGTFALLGLGLLGLRAARRRAA